MINKTERGNIFNSTAKHIVFSINAEGVVGDGFDGQVIEKGWPELLECGPQKIGTVLSKEIDGVTYHALVTHSLENGWGSPEEQRENTRMCFDNIPVPDGEEIASIAIGTGFIGAMSGAKPKSIICGMCDSKKNITYYGLSMEQIKQIYDEENIKALKQGKDSKKTLEILPPYKKLEEFYKDLSKIKKVDYTSSETSMESAIEHSRQVLTTLLRAQNLKLYKEQKNISTEKATALDWFNSNIKSIENQLAQYFEPEEFKQFKRYMKLLCSNNFKGVKNKNTGNKDLHISSKMFSRIVDSEGNVNVTKFKRFFVNVAKMLKGIEANDKKEASEALANAESEAFETKEESDEFFTTLLGFSKFSRNKSEVSKEESPKKQEITTPEKKSEEENTLGNRLESLLDSSKIATIQNEKNSSTKE